MLTSVLGYIALSKLMLLNFGAAVYLDVRLDRVCFVFKSVVSCTLTFRNTD
jgi:hypothetical protein